MWTNFYHFMAKGRGKKRKFNQKNPWFFQKGIYENSLFLTRITVEMHIINIY